MDFDQLLSSQRESQVRRFGVPPGDFLLDDRIEYIRTQVLGALDELHEVLGETGWKPWKDEGYGQVNREAYLREISDVHIFLANLVLAVGGTADELESAICATQRKNDQRMEGGY